MSPKAPPDGQKTQYKLPTFPQANPSPKGKVKAQRKKQNGQQRRNGETAAIVPVTPLKVQHQEEINWQQQQTQAADARGKGKRTSKSHQHQQKMNKAAFGATLDQGVMDEFDFQSSNRLFNKDRVS